MHFSKLHKIKGPWAKLQGISKKLAFTTRCLLTPFLTTGTLSPTIATISPLSIFSFSKMAVSGPIVSVAITLKFACGASFFRVLLTCFAF